MFWSTTHSDLPKWSAREIQPGMRLQSVSCSDCLTRRIWWRGPPNYWDMSNSPKDRYVATNYGDFKSETLWKNHVPDMWILKKNLRFHGSFPGTIAISVQWMAQLHAQAVDPIVAYDHCLTSGWWCTNHLEKWWSSSMSSSMAFGWHPIIPHFFCFLHNKSHVPKHQPDIH